MGSDAWFRYGDGFSVYFGFLARIAPFAVPGRIVRRLPLGLTIEPRPGLLAFVSVMLGSVAFDGFSRVLVADVAVRRAVPFLPNSVGIADLLTLLLNLSGLIGMICVVAVIFAQRSRARRLGHADRPFGTRLSGPRAVRVRVRGRALLRCSCTGGSSRFPCSPSARPRWDLVGTSSSTRT